MTFAPEHSTHLTRLRTWTAFFIFGRVVSGESAALPPILGTGDVSLPQEKKCFVSHWTDSLKASGNGASQR